MFRYAATQASTRGVTAMKSATRKLSDSSAHKWGQGDTGTLATRGHHAMILALTGLAPVWWVLPEESSISRGLGVLLSANVAAHTYIGMNYVATDYVPKISKALLPPARVFNVGLTLITLIGLTKMSLTSPGGIKGAIRGLWNPPKEEKK